MVLTATALVWSHPMSALHALLVCIVLLVDFKHPKVHAKLVMFVTILLVYLHQFSLMK